MKIGRFGRLRLAAPLLALAVAAAACGSDGGSSGSGSSSGSKAAAQNDLSGVTLTFATQSPYVKAAFAKSGVLQGAPYKVQFAQFNAATVTTALTTGKVDIGQLSDFALILAQANAQPAWPANDPPIQGVLATQPADDTNYPPIVTLRGKNSGIERLADLRGKKFAYSPGATSELQYLLTLKQAGLTPADVKPVQLDSTVGATALAQGDVDAWAGSPARAGAALDAGAQVLTTTKQTGALGLGVLVASRGALKDQRKNAAIRDFVGRSVAYELWNITQPDQSAQVWVDAAKLTPAKARSTAIANRQVPHVLDAALLDRIQHNTADVAYSGGLIKRAVNIRDHYYTGFNDTVAQKLKELDVTAKVDAAVAAARP
ncbi:ABC-type nitrate/sulfonate/bicarbonate transport system, periplasmic component [Frankia torreyi]|uniref:ABC-type nitrate/sulfonate/bicarbonate transport system, periplasmic component n=2 Tax=Frankia TaxID=1854 RepID=A0A0D8B9R5_9ACTN|nr:ABC transporter substrate-binding protein [Frankia torreyi]KJE21018.1 ABC-type nitrate/sulfonate/bicarbonate transport system, periplasmic component [Frankia torreyi]KQM03867.1 ABC-type nitrate/sulfonate/bicarbonate transport system, periplasmic component [Frankia sp. CpI1-P]